MQLDRKGRNGLRWLAGWAAVLGFITFITVGHRDSRPGLIFLLIVYCLGVVLWWLRLRNRAKKRRQQDQAEYQQRVAAFDLEMRRAEAERSRGERDLAMRRLVKRQLVQRRYAEQRRLTEQRSLGLDQADEMSGVDFERYVGAIFSGLGYRVSYTKAVGDFGVDLILTKDKVRTAVQCKRQSGTVGSAAVGQVVAGAAFHRCTATMVVCNTTFTAAAREFAAVHDCELVGRRDLAQLARQARTGETPVVVNREILDGVRAAVAVMIAFVDEYDQYDESRPLLANQIVNEFVSENDESQLFTGFIHLSMQLLSKIEKQTAISMDATLQEVGAEVSRLLDGE